VEKLFQENLNGKMASGKNLDKLLLDTQNNNNKNINFHTPNDTIIHINNQDQNNLITNQNKTEKPDFFEETKNFLKSENYGSYVKNNTKEKIERIIENLVELNPLLPQEILDMFSGMTKNSQKFSIINNKFNIEKFERNKK
jgi:hypothetical protein